MTPTHHVPAERRPRVQDLARWGLAVEKREGRRVAHAGGNGLALAHLSLLGLGPGQFDLPAEQLVEEAQVGLDEHCR